MNILSAVGTIQTLLDFLATYSVLLVVPLPHKVGGGSLRSRLQLLLTRSVRSCDLGEVEAVPKTSEYTVVSVRAGSGQALWRALEAATVNTARRLHS